MMRIILLILIIASAAGAATFAIDDRPPAKPPRQHATPAPDPAVLRQGGDTIADAVVIPAFPFFTTGTTAGYTNDYDEICPYPQSASPDVVYTFTPDWPGVVDIDMLGSAYDTKIYVYDENLELVACNDDYYPDYVSRLEYVAVEGGAPYYLIIDGYGGDAGDYQLAIIASGIDIITCNSLAVLEDEPPLVNDYVDEHNGGCNGVGDVGEARFQHIGSAWFCGQAGWYQREGDSVRDTDWFTLTIPSSGELVISGDATWATYMFELGPQDCDQVGVLQEVQIGPFSEGTMVINGEPGSTVWFWVGATTFVPPGGEWPTAYTYLLHIPQVVAVERRSWSAIKSLYR